MRVAASMAVAAARLPPFRRRVSSLFFCLATLQTELLHSTQ